MPRPQLPHRTERMLIARIVIALGLALLLLVGAWSNSHGETTTGTALCLAAGSPTTSVSPPQEATAPDSATPHSGLLGVCALVVFLLALVALRMLRDRALLPLGRRATASAPPRAGPLLFPRTLTLTQLSLSRT